MNESGPILVVLYPQIQLPVDPNFAKLNPRTRRAGSQDGGQAVWLRAFPSCFDPLSHLLVRLGTFPPLGQVMTFITSGYELPLAECCFYPYADAQISKTPNSLLW